VFKVVALTRVFVWQRGADDIVTIVGGVVPEADYPFLKESGVAQVYGPGTRIPDAARQLVDMLMNKTK
jgi:methylmalonyl-CoA mutase